MLAAWVEQLLGYASGALKAIRDNEHYPALMIWARDEGVVRVGGDLSLAQALAPLLWNETPLVRLGFDPEPLAWPGRNEPCWCDSGRKTKQCCGAVTLPGAVPPHLMWMLSLKEWTGETLKAALGSGKAPDQALLEAGLIAAESGQRGRAQQILESLFSSERDWSRLPEQAEPAFEILVDLYQSRGFHRKRAALLDEVLERGPTFLRGVALERLCLMHLDSDDLASAREAFVRAQQTLPDSPTLAYIESMLLLHEGHPEEARARAHFWWRRLSKRSDLESDQLQFLADLAANPEATLAEQMINSEEDLAEPLAALAALLDTLEAPPRLHLSRTPEGHVEYHATAREDTAFAAWFEYFKVTIDEEAALSFESDPWENAGEWLPALCAHPEWLGSPSVMQSLSLALTSRFGSLPWMAESFFEPLAARFEAWLSQLETQQGPFAWDDANNATLLRCALALIVGMERGARTRSRHLAERVLKLDEEDDLGLRELVLDQLLREGRDDEAAELSGAHDEEEMIGVTMARVLALYRLERRDEADEMLTVAQRANPYLVPMLCDEKPKPVALAVDAPAPGTRAEAWQYRQLMRDQWMATPGAMAWLDTHR
ncbi:SEC-C domain-containing protein [Chromohalobacter sp. TMW 2.2308]|uniref:SEC-C domain-containing protein n=1 Tax=Chromohalobacter TaxID=42054 RepID=UPI001FFD44EB|nr:MULTISPECIES: SEC-C domain-containing protein [Chromohalobacter]MCK2043819.1 SEC-C domain-containing protein [Chromohalobacter moromii]MCT8516056.1 SEC-C domain-containing protein [Chromohalobacter sp. TMW 2.2271]